MKEVIAYTYTRDLGKMTKEHAQIFTRINIAFGTLKDHKVIVKGEENLAYIEQIRGYNKDIKIVLSIGGAGAFGFSNMAMTQETRQIFLDSMMDFVKKYDLDGIDLDWEFPTADWGGDFSPKDKENFTILLGEMRSTLDSHGAQNNRKYLLTIAAGVGEWFIDTTEVAKYEKYLDEFMLMTYDLRGFGQEVTGHHTTLYTKKDDVFKMSADDGIKLLMNEGVPKDKIVIGGAMYSRFWEEVPSTNGGLLQKAKPNGGQGFKVYPALQTEVIDNPNFENFWDDEAKVPWSYSRDGVFVTYDDARSIEEKCQYILDHDLPGIMFWVYVDWPENPLIEKMKMLITFS